MPYKDKQKQKECQHQFYLDNKKEYLDHNQQRRKDRKEWLQNYLSDKSCQVCGEPTNCCLDFHHLDPDTKIGEVSEMLNGFRSMKSIMEEIAKCVIICSNCHRKVHAGVIQL